MIYELAVQYDARSSFYGKAQVEEMKNCLTLYSYDTKVAKINLCTKIAQVFNIQSSTTLRHVKEFLKQNGFTAENKTQIVKDYMVD